MPRRAAELEVEPRVDLTPMIDIVFNLLIFFMCATKFRSTEGLLLCFLPRDKGLGGSPQVADLSDVRVTLAWVDAAGRPADDAGRLVVRLAGQALNAPGEVEAAPVPEASPVWARLRERLEALRAAYQGPRPGGPEVILDARDGVPTRHVVSALDQALGARLRDVTFAAPARAE